jgi:molecular chaperone HtpG
MKTFKTESKKILDLMINSIYTHKEIFLRELISNASDALDKLYYKSLTENISSVDKSKLAIKIEIDKPNRLLKITDNGIGMTSEELEKDLGTIAQSGSLDFKQNIDKSKDVNIIGQFGVGFYSAFMVADNVEVRSKAFGSDSANLWKSSGVEGYEIEPCEMSDYGTSITLKIKNNTDNDNYDDFLDEYEIKELIKKYSDFIKYPIILKEYETKEVPDTSIDSSNKDINDEKQSTDKDTKVDNKTSEKPKTKTITEEKWETVNSMIPLWKKQKSEIKSEDYDKFYSDMFYDDKPLKVIHTSVEGNVSYKALLFIPKEAQYNYYTKDFEKGLKLYSNGVLIMDKCADLLPDCFSFVRGLVDCDLDLNISRETIQHNRQLMLIKENIQNKIKSELLDMLKTDRKTYEEFFSVFGLQLKFGTYANWGVNKDLLKDLLIYKSIKQDKMITLQEYIDSMSADQKYIYYATGKNVDAIKNLPQTENVLTKYDVICFTDDIDEFVTKILHDYNNKEFKNIASSDLGIEQKVEDNKELTDYLKECLGDKVSKVVLVHSLNKHAVCLSSEGEVSIEMEKVINSMPNTNKVNATKVLEINADHKIYDRIKGLYATNKDKLKDLALILFSSAEIVSGLSVENPSEVVDKLTSYLSD